MQALRDNPELMGTSVGMLRRATLIMLHIARNESCRKLFSKLQNRLLKFTVSHFVSFRNILFYFAFLTIFNKLLQ